MLRQDGHRLLVLERYLDSAGEEDGFDFEMRCWIPEEVREYAGSAAFTSVDVIAGVDAGIASDRLLVTARTAG